MSNQRATTRAKIERLALLAKELRAGNKMNESTFKSLVAKAVRQMNAAMAASPENAGPELQNLLSKLIESQNEHRPYKAVTGSNPVAPTILFFL